MIEAVNLAGMGSGPSSRLQRSAGVVQAEHGFSMQASGFALSETFSSCPPDEIMRNRRHYLSKSETGERVHSQLSSCAHPRPRAAGLVVRYSRFSSTVGARALAAQRKTKRQGVASLDSASLIDG